MVKISVLLSVAGAALVILAWALAPGDGTQIAFETYEDGNTEIYLLDLATGIAHSLTQHERDDSRPVWSPDGQWIAFTSNRTDNYEIYVMDARGGSIQNLTRHASDDFEPSWSSDGSHIAFVSRRDGNSELYIMTVGEILANPACTPLPDSFLLNESQPCAAPLRRVTYSDVDETTPAWSPDGQRIAFVEETDQYSEIFAIEVNCDADSEACERDRFNLSNDPARDRDPAWSPDGRFLTFASNREGAWNIYVMRADRSQTRKLTTSRGDFVHPVWSPDGQQILFTQWRGTAGWAMHIMDVDCDALPAGCRHNPRLLTDSRVDGFRPAWRP
jgi:TolB protein